MCGAKCGWRPMCYCEYPQQPQPRNSLICHSLPSSCTASILNLCAISLDRYVAVTRPVSYPSIMSTRRAKSLIAGLWVLSFVICFPPLIGWRNDDSVSIFCENRSRGEKTKFEAIHLNFNFSTSPSLPFRKVKVKEYHEHH
jgi:hypothetical protein